jgi:hypothetical protein
VGDGELAAVPLVRHGFHGEGNYSMYPAADKPPPTPSQSSTTLEVTSLRQRLGRVPAPVVDAGLALALAVANTIGIRVALAPGARPDAVAYGCGLTIAGLALARRRWPLGVLLASAATLQLYVANYTSTYRAVPLSVALATAWAAGHRRWSLLVAAWFVASPLGYALPAFPRHQNAADPAG